MRFDQLIHAGASFGFDSRSGLCGQRSTRFGGRTNPLLEQGEPRFPDSHYVQVRTQQ